MTDSTSNSTPISNTPQTPKRSKSKKSAGGSTTQALVNPQGLRELVKTLRELGVTEFKSGDLHLVLSPVGPTPIEPEQEAQPVVGPPQGPFGPLQQEISDEDLLFWSADTLESKEEKNGLD